METFHRGVPEIAPSSTWKDSGDIAGTGGRREEGLSTQGLKTQLCHLLGM